MANPFVVTLLLVLAAGLALVAAVYLPLGGGG